MRVRRRHVGTDFHLPGLQSACRLDAHVERVDNIDEFAEIITKKGNDYFYKYGNEKRPVSTEEVLLKVLRGWKRSSIT
jgi:hypothetical protein